MIRPLTTLCAIALAASSVVAAEPTAATSSPSSASDTAALHQQVQELQQRLAQLEAKQSTQQQQLDQRDVDRAMANVMNDAESHSNLMQMSGFTAGWDKDRFKIQSANGDFLIQPILHLQVRNVTSYVQDTAGNNDDEVQNGFEMRRARFGFDGNAFSKNFSYYFLWDSNRQGGNVTLWQSWVRYKFNDAMAVKLGQFVNPVDHQGWTSSSRQLTVDRSLVSNLVNGIDEPRTQAIDLSVDAGPIGLEFGYEDGFNSQNTDFHDFTTTTTGLTTTTSGDNFGAFVRANLFIFGDRKSYGDFSALGNKEDLLVIGGGLDFTQDGNVNFWRHTADIQWEVGPLGLYAAYYGNYVQDGDTGADDTYNWGALAQGGWLIGKFEPFVRYDITQFDDEVAVNGSVKDTFNELTGGFNYYFANHNIKASVDLSYLPDGSPASIGGIDVEASGDPEWLMRAQLQLAL